MHIHWFPGHMTKSLRLIEENLKAVDAIVYVLDARAPLSCINESFDKLIDGKSILYVLNKIDLADKSKVSAWQKYFADQGKNVIAVTSTEKLSSSVFINALKKIEKPKVSKFEAKGVFIPTRLMVLGVPNSGKSTLINSVCGKKSAITGNKPGKTVALRADIDALTLDDRTGVDYASEVPGMNHACGHDTHAAMLLGAAKILNEMKDEIN
ncbi:MAG: M20/M25/M40 family metallo-hydrolase, partial [Clostridia bacterium]|nr:M20/M25/M40 family metallo-hydrolase [Clostridia bacterium]